MLRIPGGPSGVGTGLMIDASSDRVSDTLRRSNLTTRRKKVFECLLVRELPTQESSCSLVARESGATVMLCHRQNARGIVPAVPKRKEIRRLEAYANRCVTLGTVFNRPCLWEKELLVL